MQISSFMVMIFNCAASSLLCCRNYLHIRSIRSGTEGGHRGNFPCLAWDLAFVSVRTLSRYVYRLALDMNLSQIIWNFIHHCGSMHSTLNWHENNRRTTQISRISVNKRVVSCWWPRFCGFYRISLSTIIQN